MIDPGLIDQTDAAIEWYWKHGHLRKDAYALNGPWLDRLYQVNHQARAIARLDLREQTAHGRLGSIANGKKHPAFQPISTGRTSMTRATIPRSNGAWTNPSASSSASDKPSDVIVLNPFNKGSDASGCVTRFTLRDHVADPPRPVEIELATESQIMHALAVGYLSECKVGNAKGESVAFDPESFRALARQAEVRGRAQPRRVRGRARTGRPDRAADPERTRTAALQEPRPAPGRKACAASCSNPPP